MKIYILWREDYDCDLKSHIIGIFKEKEVALKKCNKYNGFNIKTKDIIKIIDNKLLGEFNLYDNDDIYYCGQIDVDNSINELYFLKTKESRGGDNYHTKCWIYLCLSVADVIDNAITYFKNEHNRKNECTNCINDSCKNKLIIELKNKNKTYFSCTDYRDTSIEICKIAIQKI